RKSCPSSIMASGYLMSAPVCFIENAEKEKLLVRKEAQDSLNGINVPVVVVSIVGLYRTGKSFLMDLLAGQQSGFTFSNTILNQRPKASECGVPHPTKGGHTLVLLDTEGLGDIDKYKYYLKTLSCLFQGDSEVEIRRHVEGS
ncbi:putative interferon-induced guanylate-binding protein 1, partial [Triplophysa rosa]